jgi:hypothetical protein
MLHVYYKTREISRVTTGLARAGDAATVRLRQRGELSINKKRETALGEQAREKAGRDSCYDGEEDDLWRSSKLVSQIPVHYARCLRAATRIFSRSIG